MSNENTQEEAMWSAEIESEFDNISFTKEYARHQREVEQFWKQAKQHAEKTRRAPKSERWQ